MRLLFVEGEPERAELLRKGLEEENHRVGLAREGRQGFELARIYDFDAIVLDVMLLPRIDGYAVTRKPSGAVRPGHPTQGCRRAPGRTPQPAAA